MLLTNLANNAIKACKGSGKIVLSCGIENGTPFVSVSDNGVGMTEEQIMHITEPFYRTDRARSRGEGGTGLGLSLCARIAEAHHATLKFQSVPEKGTKVFVTFTTL
jgi:signal transduction histidine kinase